jgi:hypothetical protein
VIFRELVQDPSWYVASDITGKARVIKEKNKLQRAFLVLPTGRERERKMQFKECSYHIFDNLPAQKPPMKADVPKLTIDMPNGTSLFPT